MMINISYHRSVTIGTTNEHLILFRRRVTVAAFIDSNFSQKRFDFVSLSMAAAIASGDRSSQASRAAKDCKAAPLPYGCLAKTGEMP